MRGQQGHWPFFKKSFKPLLGLGFLLATLVFSSPLWLNWFNWQPLIAQQLGQVRKQTGLNVDVKGFKLSFGWDGALVANFGPVLIEQAHPKSAWHFYMNQGHARVALWPALMQGGNNCVKKIELMDPTVTVEGRLGLSQLQTTFQKLTQTPPPAKAPNPLGQSVITLQKGKVLLNKAKTLGLKAKTLQISLPSLFLSQQLKQNQLQARGQLAVFTKAPPEPNNFGLLSLLTPSKPNVSLDFDMDLAPKAFEVKGNRPPSLLEPLQPFHQGVNSAKIRLEINKPSDIAPLLPVASRKLLTSMAQSTTLLEISGPSLLTNPYQAWHLQQQLTSAHKAGNPLAVDISFMLPENKLKPIAQISQIKLEAKYKDKPLLQAKAQLNLKGKNAENPSNWQLFSNAVLPKTSINQWLSLWYDYGYPFSKAFPGGQGLSPALVKQLSQLKAEGSTNSKPFKIEGPLNNLKIVGFDAELLLNRLQGEGVTLKKTGNPLEETLKVQLQAAGPLAQPNWRAHLQANHLQLWDETGLLLALNGTVSGNQALVSSKNLTLALLNEPPVTLQTRLQKPLDSRSSVFAYAVKVNSPPLAVAPLLASVPRWQRLLGLKQQAITGLEGFKSRLKLDIASQGQWNPLNSEFSFNPTGQIALLDNALKNHELLTSSPQIILAFNPQQWQLLPATVNLATTKNKAKATLSAKAQALWLPAKQQGTYTLALKSSGLAGHFFSPLLKPSRPSSGNLPLPQSIDGPIALDLHGGGEFNLKQLVLSHLQGGLSLPEGLTVAMQHQQKPFDPIQLGPAFLKLEPNHRLTVLPGHIAFGPIAANYNATSTWKPLTISFTGKPLALSSLLSQYQAQITLPSLPVSSFKEKPSFFTALIPALSDLTEAGLWHTNGQLALEATAFKKNHQPQQLQASVSLKDIGYYLNRTPLPVHHLNGQLKLVQSGKTLRLWAQQPVRLKWGNGPVELTSLALASAKKPGLFNLQLKGHARLTPLEFNTLYGNYFYFQPTSYPLQSEVWLDLATQLQAGHAIKPGAGAMKLGWLLTLQEDKASSNPVGLTAEAKDLPLTLSETSLHLMPVEALSQLAQTRDKNNGLALSSGHPMAATFTQWQWNSHQLNLLPQSGIQWLATGEPLRLKAQIQEPWQGNLKRASFAARFLNPLDLLALAPAVWNETFKPGGGKLALDLTGHWQPEAGLQMEGMADLNQLSWPALKLEELTSHLTLLPPVLPQPAGVPIHQQQPPEPAKLKLLVNTLKLPGTEVQAQFTAHSISQMPVVFDEGQVTGAHFYSEGVQASLNQLGLALGNTVATGKPPSQRWLDYNRVLLPFEIRQARVHLDEAVANNLILDDVKTSLNLFANGTLELNPLTLRVGGGQTTGSLLMNPSADNAISMTIDSQDVKANALARALLNAPNQLFGDLNGRIQFATKGNSDVEMVQNANGMAAFSIDRGRVPTITQIETLLTAANLLRGGLLGLTLGNLVHLIHPPDYVGQLGGDFQIAEGVLYTSNLLADGDNLDLKASGGIRLDNGVANLQVVGNMRQNITQNPLGRVGLWNLRNAVTPLPLLGQLPNNQPGLVNYLPGVGFIPGLGGLPKDVNRFSVKLDGPLDSPRAFKGLHWLK